MQIFQEQDVELLKKLFSGTISEKERQQLEPKLNTPGSEEELKLYEAFFNVLEQKEDLRLKNMLKEHIPERKKGARRSLISPWLKVAAAAAVLLLLVALWYFNRPTLPDYFTAYPVIGAVIDRNDPRVLTPLQRAMGHYSKGQFHEALSLFETLPPTSSTSVKFYWSNALIADHQPEAAVPKLEEVVADEASIYANPAKFYLGLAYYHLGDAGNARRWLEACLDTTGLPANYKETARQILGQLTPD